MRALGLDPNTRQPLLDKQQKAAQRVERRDKKRERQAKDALKPAQRAAKALRKAQGNQQCMLSSLIATDWPESLSSLPHRRIPPSSAHPLA